MSQHYDIAIIGSNPAARIAGFLLARQGARVANLCDATPLDCGWLLPSLHLEQLLGLLGGKSEHAPPPRLQVISERYRLEINGSYSLETEIGREFPEARAEVQALLNQLAVTGRQLEEKLIRGKGLPLYHRGLFPRGPRIDPSSLPSRLNELPCPDQRDLFSALFSGLTLAAPHQVSLAEAGLLWNALMRPFSVTADALDLLLARRFEAAGGTLLRQKPGTRARLTQSQGWALEFSQGSPLRADQVLLGRSDLYAPEADAPQTAPPSRPLRESTLPSTALSPLLAPWIILATDPAMRITLTPVDGQSTAFRAETAPPQESGDGETPQQGLQRIFPFVSPEQMHLPAPPPASPRPSRRFPGAESKAVSGRKLYRCDGRLLYPRLGFIGEVLIGFSAARQLGRRIAGRQPVEKI